MTKTIVARPAFWALVAIVGTGGAGLLYLLAGDARQPTVDNTAVAQPNESLPNSDRPTSAPSRPNGAPSPPGTRSETGSWEDAFAVSENYGEFIRNALEAALAGDADAQYSIAQAVATCRTAKALYRGGQITPADLFEKDKSAYSTEMQDQMLLHYKRCIDFVRHDPFSALPPMAHGYKWEYWLAEAAKNGNADAVADLGNVSASDAAQSRTSEAEKTLQNEALRTTVIKSLEVRDVSHLARLAPLLNKTPIARPDAGFALMLAGCDLGMACDGPDVINPECQSNTARCIPSGTLQDYVLQQVGQVRYGQVLVMADQVLQALKQNDRDQIQRVLFRN